ncbi:hypothetical protein CANCADRAFT_73098 [Tortispora caseinolytica NRRL Y-17796]|uniref:t-SNARE affecting a late Golgi compartment protein 1 n=1 Tax=Tortispora caseinolytica NRRL Y-17796 TaxID=767744 RepID=A0A1E4TII9_9ASCO|nr:hypothetical protein CANCADRAFT_73098 [Tortispora caseinolytica NRRL Y-17796]
MDPYSQVEADVIEQLETLRNDVYSLERLQGTRGPEYDEAVKEAKALIDEVRDTFEDMKVAIETAEGDPSQYGVDLATIQRRKVKLREYEEQLAELCQPLQSAVAVEEPDRDETVSRFAAEQQQLIIEQQDRDLDGVMGSVQTLRNQAQLMGDELLEHSALIDDMDYHIDRVQDRLRRGMKRINYVLENNKDTVSNCCIALLTIILIVLLVLLVV